MNTKLRVLIVEDSEDDVQLLVRELKSGGYLPIFETVVDAVGMKDALDRQAWDLILADYNLPSFSGFEALSITRERELDVPFIIVSGNIGEETAVAAMKAGAHDYMMKGNLARLVPAVQRELAEARIRQEHRQVEQQLRQLSRAVRQSPIVIMITNRNGDIEYVNPKFTEVTGYTFQEVLGKNPRILKSGQASAEIFRDLWETISSGREWRGELHNQKKNGELYWESASISPVRDASGVITHFLAVKEDITERKHDQERIRQQAALLDQTQDAILVLGLDQRIHYLNQTAERSYGVPADQLLSQSAGPFLFQEHPERCADVCQKTLESGNWSEEISHTTTLGARRVVFSRWTLIHDDQGRPTSFLIVNTDVTEHKRLEEQFLRAQRMEGIGTLASGVAHDLNNILAPILMSADLLRPLAQTTQDKGLITMIEQSAKRAADIVKQLLTYGRGVEGRRIKLRPINILKEMVKVIRETFPKNLNLRQQFPENLWAIEADPTQIHQVLLNLCVNARDAMPRGGQLTIAAENLMVDEAYATMNSEIGPGPYVVLEVHDTGMGIAQDILHKIFDPFFTTKEVGKGTGLGLSTVLGIVKSHGGFVQVNSRVGEGTQFKVYLPAQVKESELIKQTSTDPLPQGNRELVLLVDDEEAIRRVAQHTLEANGYRVITAGDGAEALLALSRSREKIGAVVTDMLMPVMDGATLIRSLRRHALTLPVIAMSGLAEQEEAAIEAGLNQGVFLIKPFNADKLLRTLHRIFRSTDDEGLSVNCLMSEAIGFPEKQKN